METFKLKIQTEQGPQWLKRGGQKIEITSRKALRNFLRNRRMLCEAESTIYLNDQPFKFIPRP